MSILTQRALRARSASRTLFSPWVPLTGGVLAGSCLGLASGLSGANGTTVTAIAVFGLLSVGAPLLIAQRISRRVIEDTRSAINARPLLGDALLYPDRLSMDPPFPESLIALIDRLRPSLVLECGSGFSTLLIAKQLCRYGTGRVVALEHEPAYAERSKELLRRADLSRVAEVVDAPLVERELDGTPVHWYAPNYEEWLDGPINMVVVDGAPATRSTPLARYPAVPLLRDRLAEGCTILLDDADRPGERRIAYRWARELSLEIRYLPGGKGRWLLWRGSEP